MAEDLLAARVKLFRNRGDAGRSFLFLSDFLAYLFNLISRVSLTSNGKKPMSILHIHSFITNFIQFFNSSILSQETYFFYFAKSFMFLIEVFLLSYCCRMWNILNL